MTKHPKRALTDAELQGMRDVCRSTRDRAIFEFLRVTGCREHEMLEVKFGDLDLPHNLVFFRVTKAKPIWKTIVENGVRKRVHEGSEVVPRQTFLDGRSRSSLKLYIEEQYKKLSIEMRKKVEPRDVREQRLFRVCERGVRNLIKKLAQDAGIPDWEHISPHYLRHTRATNLLAMGYAPDYIKQDLGWSPKSWTFETTYNHPTLDMRQRSYNRVLGEEEKEENKVDEGVADEVVRYREEEEKKKKSEEKSEEE